MDPVLNQLLADASSAATTTKPPENLLAKLNSEGGEKTAQLLLETAKALKLAQHPDSSDLSRQAAVEWADKARDSTFPKISAMEETDDVRTGEWGGTRREGGGGMAMDPQGEYWFNQNWMFLEA